ncbi:hypothetical protein [uncultured Dysgonomonas sp.]|uniref:Uncharacterized protein n=1 Tax=uncultured Dysgonomonas sp. TaxID=206096 RepID=A0A212J938_9BACT|nr:hypothetical protein [uncultured Dysgonomonas sp.]SBV95952.1 conserved hypothetical protein [uncultured Dysgonomonas sp.]
MSAKQIRNTAKVLLLLYIGYFSCVSYFIHTHIYNGVVYVHSHPYNKFAKDADDNQTPPFETHHHTSAGFFTFNQLSNLASFEALPDNNIGEITQPVLIVTYKQFSPQIVTPPVVAYISLRAPPRFS